MSCCGLQELTQMGLELDCSDVLAAVQRVPGVPHLHPCCSGYKDDLKAAVLLIVEFLVPPAWEGEREREKRLSAGGFG